MDAHMHPICDHPSCPALLAHFHHDGAMYEPHAEHAPPCCVAARGPMMLIRRDDGARFWAEVHLTSPRYTARISLDD